MKLKEKPEDPQPSKSRHWLVVSTRKGMKFNWGDEIANTWKNPKKRSTPSTKLPFREMETTLFKAQSSFPKSSVWCKAGIPNIPRTIFVMFICPLWQIMVVDTYVYRHVYIYIYYILLQPYIYICIYIYSFFCVGQIARHIQT